MKFKYLYYIERTFFCLLLICYLFVFGYFISGEFRFISLLLFPFVISLVVNFTHENNDNHLIPFVKIRKFLWKYMGIEEKKKFYFDILVWLMYTDAHSHKILLEIIAETQISPDNLSLSLYDSIDNDFLNEKSEKWKELTHYVYIRYGQLDNIVTTDVEIKFGHVPSITKFLLEKNEIINKLEHSKFNKFINTGKMG